MNKMHREIVLKNGIFKAMDPLKKTASIIYRPPTAGNSFPFPKNLSAPTEIY